MTIDKATTHVPSTSDERVVNNVMRHNYRVLSDEEKQHMQMLKDLGLEFVRTLHVVAGTEGVFAASRDHAALPSRELSLAQTKIEEAVMWAVKHLTK